MRWPGTGRAAEGSSQPRPAAHRAISFRSFPAAAPLRDSMIALALHIVQQGLLQSLTILLARSAAGEDQIDSKDFSRRSPSGRFRMLQA